MSIAQQTTDVKLFPAGITWAVIFKLRSTRTAAPCRKRWINHFIKFLAFYSNFIIIITVIISSIVVVIIIAV